MPKPETSPVEEPAAAGAVRVITVQGAPHVDGATRPYTEYVEVAEEGG